MLSERDYMQRPETEWIGGAPMRRRRRQTPEQELVSGLVALLAAVLVAVGWFT
jgi:hypothetical protein